MKKVFSIIALALMTTFVACGSGETKEEAPAVDTTVAAPVVEEAPVADSTVAPADSTTK